MHPMPTRALIPDTALRADHRPAAAVPGVGAPTGASELTVRPSSPSRPPRVLRLLLGLALALSLQAQETFEMAGQWVGDRFLVSNPLGKTLLLAPDHQRTPLLKGHQKPDPDAAGQRHAGLSAGAKGFVDGFNTPTSKLWFAQERYGYTAFGAEGTGPKAVLWRLDAPGGTPSGQWREEAFLALPPQEGYIPPRPWIFPLRNGRYAVFSREPLKDSDGKTHRNLFHLMKKAASGELVHADAQPLFFEGETDIPAFRDFLVLGDPFTIVGDALILGHPHFGLFWKLDLDTGRLSGPKAVYKDIDEAAVKRDQMLNVVYHFQPTKQGEVLIYAREQGAVTEGHATWTRLKAKVESAQKQASGVGRLDASTKDKQTRYMDLMIQAEAFRDELYLAHPFVTWFRLSTEPFSIRRCEAPEGVDQLLDSLRKVDRPWIPDPGKEDALVYLDTWLKQPPPPSLPKS